MRWELVPRRGVRSGGVDVSLGMERAAIRSELSAILGEPRSHFPDEDDYTCDEHGTWLRLRFDGERLQDVEFLRGELYLDGVPLHAGARWSRLSGQLAALGFAFSPAAELGDGQECPRLGVNIATHGDVGGDGDGIEWVIVAAAIAVGDGRPGTADAAPA
jgi:hypothetical protein